MKTIDVKKVLFYGDEIMNQYSKDNINEP